MFDIAKARRVALSTQSLVGCAVVTLALLPTQATAQPPSPTPASDGQKAPPPPVEISSDSFRVRSADGKNELRFAAAAHFDARAYFGDSVAPSSFDIRRARIDAQAKLHGFISLRIQAALEDQPYIRNAWLDLRTSEALHLRFGQMKVPFSTEWLTLDNQVNFIERATSRPVYPFFDRGVMVWGDLAKGRLTYGLGAFDGVGVDFDAAKGDIDDHKEVAARLFGQPVRGLYLAAQATHGAMSVPTSRFETGGLTSASYESKVFTWRTEQTLGSNGRAVDKLAAQIDARTRWGLEAHYLRGPFTASFEYLVNRYRDISVYHEYWVGSSRLLQQPELQASGDVRLLSGWVSWFPTGEAKAVAFDGWKQPDAKRPWVSGGSGHGAVELLLRLSHTRTDPSLFASHRVYGYTAEELPASGAPAVGDSSSVTAAVLQGASSLYEVTLGVSWTLNRNLRAQAGLTELWVPDFGEGTGGIVSGGGSDLSDATLKNRQVESELSVGARLIFRF
jgi:phosphate-selective porin OprO/OprP